MPPPSLQVEEAPSAALVWFCLLALSPLPAFAAAPDLVNQPYLLDTGLVSRSISFENPTGAPGAGGKAASNLGPGRKGAPAREIKPGETVPLCDIEGPGTIRHIWMTTSGEPAVQRECVIRAWWDGQEHPSIECPIGDFFGFAHGKIMSYQSAVHSCGPTGGRNLWLPMPFAKRARLDVHQRGQKARAALLPDQLHAGRQASARRGPAARAVPPGEPHDREDRTSSCCPSADRRAASSARSSASATCIRTSGGAKARSRSTWTATRSCPPSWARAARTTWGCPGASRTPVPLQRLQPEREELRLDVPLAPARPDRLEEGMPHHHPADRLEERPGGDEDDWSCATFWYEPVPSAPLPALPDVSARTADLWKN